MMAPGTPTISSQFNAISVGFSGDQGLVQALPTKYSQAAASQDLLTGDLKQLLSATMGIDPSTPALSVAVASVAKNSILPDLLTALAAQRDYQPSDKGAPPLLADLQALQTELNNMPFDFSDGDKLQAGETISCRGANTKKIGWTDWYAQCKDQYDSLKKSLQDATASAQTYSTGSDNDKALKNKAAIVLYWKARLDALGITSPGPINLLPFSVARQDIGCHSIFNFNSSTAVSLVVVDERPTLDGTAPTAKASDPFLTVTCASRIGVSAGAGFSTILQHGFAIVKSAGGTNGASVNRFDALNDSRFNPLPMALAHARLKEFAGHLIALHATVGVAGNLQGQSSGGSAVEFLLGGSVSFVRVIYLSAGLHIGTKDELAGGFKVGDLVPSDITTIQGQVKRSYTTGFGFAISFTKP
jgi:hypothetical protein